MRIILLLSYRMHRYAMLCDFRTFACYRQDAKGVDRQSSILWSKGHILSLKRTATQATYYNLVLDCVTVLLLVTLYYLCTNSSKRLNGLHFSRCQHETKYGPIQWNSSIFPVFKKMLLLSTFYKLFLIFNGQKRNVPAYLVSYNLKLSYTEKWHYVVHV